MVGLALKEPELSPRELTIAFADRQQYFVSEASVYRLLKARELITRPALILMQAADTFAQPTTAPNHLTPADVYFGRGQAILTRRKNIKLKTIELRRRLHHASAALTSTPMSQILS